MAADGLMIQNGRLWSQPIPFLDQESWTSPLTWVHSCPFQPPALGEPLPHPGLQDEGRKRRGKGQASLRPGGSSICAFDINTQGSLQTNPGGPLQTRSVPRSRVQQGDSQTVSPRAPHSSQRDGTLCAQPPGPLPQGVSSKERHCTQWLHFLLLSIYYRVSGHKGSTSSVIAPEGGSDQYDLGAHASAWPTRLQALRMEGTYLNTPTCPDQSLVHSRTMLCPGMGSTEGEQPEKNIKETANSIA